MSSKVLIKESLFLLNNMGLILLKPSFLDKLKTGLGLLLLIYTGIDVSLECTIHFDGLNSVEAISVAIAMYLLTIKICTFLAYKKSFFKLFGNMEKFWPIDTYGTELKNEILGIYNRVKQMLQVIFVILMVVVFGFAIQPLFSETRQLYYKMFYLSDLNQSPQYELALVFQTLTIIIACSIQLGFDGLFISLIIHLMCEIKLLKKGFENVPIDIDSKTDTKEPLTYLYKMVDHHNLILESIGIMKNIYSVVLLNVYLFNMSCICNGLLGVIASGLPPTIESIIQFGTLAVFYTVQLFFYCSAGNYLTSESETISASLYNTKWWIKTQPKLRNIYRMVILRSNKIEELTAGGMFSLNLHSFRKVLRSALSFFTLVQAVYKDEVSY